MTVAMPIAAQHTASGYFTDGYLYRHEMNPAIANEQSYVAMPGISNLNVAMRSNIGVKDVLFNRNGKTTTFLNPNVSASEFLSGINDNNKVNADIKVTLLGVGFKGFNGYNHISINARANVGVNIPGSLLRLAKEGVENKTYDISDFRAHADAYTEIALGHSHKLNDQWSVGATLKVLLGGANVDAEFNKAELSLEDNAWNAVTNGEIQASVKGLTYKQETKMRGADENHPHTYVNDVDVKNTGLNGFGLGLDLGAVFTLNEYWKFSAALLDLGFISWNNNMVASTNGDQTFTTDTYLFNVDKDANNKFSREMDNLKEGVSALYELQDMGDKGSRSTGLASTLNIGAEFTLPAYDKLTFGLLNTTRMNSKYSWTDFRLSANWRTSKIFSMGTNFAVGTYGASFGWILNLHPNGFNCFLAMDHTLGKLAKQGVPLSGNAHVNFGMNFPF
jgi:hypothetical protein